MNLKKILKSSVIIIMGIGVFIQNEFLNVTLFLLFLVGTLFALHKDLPYFTEVTNDSDKNGTLKSAYYLVLIVVVISIVGVIMVKENLFTELTAKIYASGMMSSFILFFGHICDNLPFNRYLGLRLPWTLMDEETWIIAHKVLAHLSVPLVAIYFVLIPFVDFKKLSGFIIITWIVVPSVVSYIFYYRKFK